MVNGIFSQNELKDLLGGYKKKLEFLNIPGVNIYLYGSYAKNTPKTNSDVDICVISPAFNDRIEATMMLMKIRDGNELMVSPIAFSPESFIDENPLAWEIKQTGIKV